MPHCTLCACELARSQVERGAMTTLRNSQLLNAHALVIAEKCNPRDMAEYKGMISFVNMHQVR